VLDCLQKDPDRRPQSAAELRRRVEACSIQPWDSARALAWWREFQSALDADTVQMMGEGLTIAVDGAYRSSTEPSA
jgi:hypothetical protein